MFSELVSINFMLVVLAFVFVTIFAVNILAALTNAVLSMVIKIRKLRNS